MPEKDRLHDLTDLPLEIIEMIVLLLSRSDMTVRVRVNKAWRDQFINYIWHAILSEAAIHFQIHGLSAIDSEGLTT